MWCCLILQTLPTQTLAQYLSHGLAARAGCHLNIASPLSQSSRSRELEIGSFGNPHASNDPLIRKYSEEQAIQYRALRISDDPILRDYYWQNAIKAGESAMKTGRAISCKRAASGKRHKGICCASAQLTKHIYRSVCFEYSSKPCEASASTTCSCAVHRHRNAGY